MQLVQTGHLQTHLPLFSYACNYVVYSFLLKRFFLLHTHFEYAWTKGEMNTQFKARQRVLNRTATQAQVSFEALTQWWNDALLAF